MMQEQVRERSNAWLTRQIELPEQDGLHMRSAQRIVQTACRYDSEVRATKDSVEVNAKSLVDMIEFAAYVMSKDSEEDNGFHFRAQGTDAADVLEALDVLVNQPCGLD